MNTNEAPILLPTGSTAEQDANDHHPFDIAASATDTMAENEPPADPTGQLLLLAVDDAELSESSAHTRFRLNKQTRERGLRHVAEIRAQLAAARERTASGGNVVSLPPRREPAA